MIKYREQDLVRIAKRENNIKRTYLVTNRLQGKYIPARPHSALEMFRALAGMLKGRFPGETLLLIGFAETATAIGAAAALELGTCYMHTTREDIPDTGCLQFLEEHSHAAQQRLIREDIDAAAGKFDRIVFIEDEVTTGKTILNIIDLLEAHYPGCFSFSVASLLNGMDGPALARCRDRGIGLFWLVKTDHSRYAQIAASCREDGRYIACGTDLLPKKIQDIRTGRMMDARRLVTPAGYAAFCEALWQQIGAQADLQGADRILVLGTEEFMYPALFAADRLERLGRDVWFHTTTRGPVAVSTAAGYPLHTRCTLKSMYDSSRTTYLYDLDRYDAVVIITDAKGDIEEGAATLLNALALCGNDRAILVHPDPSGRCSDLI